MLDLNSRGVIGIQEMGNQKISVADHIDVKSDSFTVDLETFSNGVDKDFTTNSTITRSLSRKGPQRSTDREIASSYGDCLLSSSSSPAAALVGVTSVWEKPATPPHEAAAKHPPTNQPPQHQITIKTADTGAMADSRWDKRSGIRRSPPSRFSDPRRILLLFASLSSVGTMLLIFFTLTMSKPNENF
ncbi:hypothetical protein Nepgr_032128 [Nepenthes gracilis]|uniref:Uncharacterized protein n=1 Tax=Nepenthes gracilis TaxID=150966 RepID=A0AAD3Y7F6_NEPGR|nr:hypothetical protein Nepgr_032128 [Nepenthes gracilis]